MKEISGQLEITHINRKLYKKFFSPGKARWEKDYYFLSKKGEYAKITEVIDTKGEVSILLRGAIKVAS
jgi:hypothetical protein